MNKRIKSK